MLRLRSLGSGSTGNATLVEARSGTTVTRLLIDCGLGIRQLETRLGAAGLAIEMLDALFITHEHADHVGSARAVALRARIPVWMSQGTHAGAGLQDFGDLLRVARDGETITVGDLALRPFTVPHDAREPLQLVCSDGARRLAVLTDLGHASSHVLRQLEGCDALMLECNHDPQLLAASRYPPFLKRRVGGPWGHLSNGDAADIARAVRHPGLRQVMAAHLSEQNNRPELARAALAGALGCTASDVRVASASGHDEWMTV